MATAKALLNEALKGPMRDAGWTPKAAGWFVRSVTQDCVAVVAASVASKHALAGEGQATAHIGLRVELVEQTVHRLLGVKDEGYRSRTATTPLGYATAQNRWLEWPVTEAQVEQVAGAMAGVLTDDGWQYVRSLADDADSLLAATKASPASGTSIGLGRMVVLLGGVGRDDEARRVIEARKQQAEGRSDAAAQDVLRVADVLLAWLRNRE